MKSDVQATMRALFHSKKKKNKKSRSVWEILDRSAPDVDIQQNHFKGPCMPSGLQANTIGQRGYYYNINIIKCQNNSV